MKQLLIYLLIILFCLFMADVTAQVDQIKSSSSINSSAKGSRSGERGGSSSVGFSYFFIDLIGNGIVAWQRDKLHKREINPRIVSLEFPLQIAMQPSAYYLFNPRVRGNWGLFSTDFRVNYLIEQDINGLKDLATFDWQIIQLNLITTRNVIGRVGFGTMKENFGDMRSFLESSFSLSVFSSDHKIGGNMEYRVAKDYDIYSTPRREVSVSIEKQIFTIGASYGLVTLGGVYQRYYNNVSVWGIQAGMVFRIHRPVEFEKVEFQN